MFYSLFQGGHIDFLTSDHSPTLPKLKLLDDGNFLKAWGGISSLQVSDFVINLLSKSWIVIHFFRTEMLKTHWKSTNW